MMRVAIVGGAGRMGQAMAAGLRATAEFEIVALIDPSPPRELSSALWHRRVDELDSTTVDVIVDFSTPEVTRTVLAFALEHQIALVVGTTGLSANDLIEMGEWVRDAHGHVLIASNFAIGAVLSERFAVQAARHFDRVEIIELHHDGKVAAPSGTSMAAARAIAAARAAAELAPLTEPTETETLPHPRGADGADGVRIHSVRLPGLVAHQEVIFGSPSEGLTIRHDSYSRQSFVAGVALAVRHVGERPGLTLGLDELV
jgi:4-hydroxy-tetrahydrodipicolinate reductase